MMATPKRWIASGIVLTSLAMSCGQTTAGILDSVITNPVAYYDGFTTWQGVRNVVQNVSGLYTVNANLSYSVFAPGDFQNFLNLNLIPYTYVDPEPIEGPKYIYAYQVQVISATQFFAPSGVDIFTVGRDGDEILIDSAPSSVPGTGNQAPTLTAYQGTSYLWDFDLLLNGGEVSTILFFASPTRPEWDFAQVNVGLASGRTDPPVGGLPSPLPEPTTMSIGLLLGTGMLMGRRRR